MKKIKLTIIPAIAIVIVGYFYYYNNIKNQADQAKKLNITGLRDFICKQDLYDSSKADQCGNKSIYKDADWGITAYYTIYGITNKDEAKSIINFIKNNRDKSNVPISVEIYSSPRSATPSRPDKNLILKENF